MPRIKVINNTNESTEISMSKRAFDNFKKSLKMQKADGTVIESAEVVSSDEVKLTVSGDVMDFTIDTDDPEISADATIDITGSPTQELALASTAADDDHGDGQDRKIKFKRF